MKLLHELLRDVTKEKYESDIIIVGKGASIDSVRMNLLNKKIIINANDSESILKGDIGVFHHDWVFDYFKKYSPTCKLYVTNHAVRNISNVYKAKVAPNDEEKELFIDRFFDKKVVWLEQAVLISCLRVANEIALAWGANKRVYLLGFDFSLQNGFSSFVENGLHGADDAYVDHLVRMQEIYLERILSERQRLNIEIIHIGSRPYSLYSIDAFNALQDISPTLINKSTSKDIELNNDGRVIIVAEITTNHFGDKERLRAMILLAHKAGADYIKLQKRDVETFYKEETLLKTFNSPFGKDFRSYRQGLELTKQDFEWVDSFCREIGIGWFASILDEVSFEFIKEFNPELIKLPSTISEKKGFLAKVGTEWDKGLVISTGMTGAEYEDFILNSFNRAKKIYMLQCTSAYPTPENDAGIGVVRHYRDLSIKDERIIPGYSSHDIGSLCCQLAVAAGAKMIEKHVKLGSVQWAHFDEVALDLATDEFAKFVVDIRRAERIVGSENKFIFDTEHHKY